MIDKKLAHDLQWIADDLVPYPFTIVTSIGHVEQTTGYTRDPLQLSFQVKPKVLSAPISLKCAVMNATSYDILVGQQTLHPLGFCLYNWTEEV